MDLQQHFYSLRHNHQTPGKYDILQNKGLCDNSEKVIQAVYQRVPPPASALSWGSSSGENIRLMGLKKEGGHPQAPTPASSVLDDTTN